MMSYLLDSFCGTIYAPGTDMGMFFKPCLTTKLSTERKKKRKCALVFNIKPSTNAFVNYTRIFH